MLYIVPKRSFLLISNLIKSNTTNFNEVFKWRVLYLLKNLLICSVDLSDNLLEILAHRQIVIFIFFKMSSCHFMFCD